MYIKSFIEFINENENNNNEKELKIKSISKKGAYLVTDGEIEFWVMPSMVRADGSFTPGVYKKYKEELEKHQISKDRFGFTRYKIWNAPGHDNFRIYINGTQDYIGVKLYESRPKGYYERHRAAKGEKYYTAFVYNYPQYLDKYKIADFLNYIAYSLTLERGVNIKTIFKKEEDTN